MAWATGISTPPEDVAAGEERVSRLLAGEIDPYSVERRYVRKDRSCVWVNLSVSLVRTTSKESDCLVCVAEDITARKLRELVPDPLTPLETQVLHKMVAGSKNREIADDLRYSMGSVKRCVQGIIRKLRTGDRRRAAIRAIEIGLIAPPPTKTL